MGTGTAVSKLTKTDCLLLAWSGFQPGGRLNIKMSSYQYRDPRVKDKVVSRRLIFDMGIPCLGKTVFILSQCPGRLTNPLDSRWLIYPGSSQNFLLDSLPYDEWAFISPDATLGIGSPFVLISWNLHRMEHSCYLSLSAQSLFQRGKCFICNGFCRWLINFVAIDLNWVLIIALFTILHFTRKRQGWGECWWKMEHVLFALFSNLWFRKRQKCM